MNSSAGVFGKLMIALSYPEKSTLDPVLRTPTQFSIFRLLSPHCMDPILTDPGFSGFVSVFTLLTY
jgi:hypothetical protein